MSKVIEDRFEAALKSLTFEVKSSFNELKSDVEQRVSDIHDELKGGPGSGPHPSGQKTDQKTNNDGRKLVAPKRIGEANAGAAISRAKQEAKARRDKL